MAAPINIFIIYAREDREIKQRLLLHLNPLKNEFNTNIWHDDYIEPGQAWKPNIESRLEKTDLFILLVSIDFMNSEFINHVEFKYAIDRHRSNKSVMIPVIIKFCQWKINIHFDEDIFNLSELQVLPPEGRPIEDWRTADQAYNEIAAGIITVLTTIKRTREEKLQDKETHDINTERKRKESDERQKVIDLKKKKLLEKERKEKNKISNEPSIPKAKTGISKVALIIACSLVVFIFILWILFKKEVEPEKKSEAVVITNVDPTEQQAWNSAVTENTPESYRAYQRSYQTGKFYGEAQEKIAHLEKKESAFKGLYPQASERILKSGDFEGLTKWEIRIMRNEIFARHNYIFTNDTLKLYFNQQPWYNGIYKDVTNQLSGIERINIVSIKNYE